MKNTIALMISLLMVLMAGCGKSDSPADAAALLRTVPTDVDIVMVADIESILEKSGAKVEDDKTVKDKELREALAAVDKKGRLASFLDGESGVRLTALVCFMRGGRFYATAMLNDAEQFRKYIESHPEAEGKAAAAPWQKEGDYYVTGNLVQHGEQVWIMPDVSAVDVVKDFVDMTEARSFSSNEYAAALAKCDNNLMCYGSISGVLNAMNLSFSERSMASMAVSMVFDDAKYLSLSANVDDKALKMELDVLNSDNKVAKCNLKLGEINVEQVSALGGNANLVMAVDMPHALVEQLMKFAESFGGAMPQQYKDVLMPIDGTVTVAAPSTKSMISAGDEGAFIASISTKGNQATLMESLYGMGLKPTSEGDMLKFSRGNYGAGAYKVSEIAQKMKGSSFAYALHEGGKTPYDVFVTLKKSEGGLQLNCEWVIAGSSDHLLINVIKSLK